MVPTDDGRGRRPERRYADVILTLDIDVESLRTQLGPAAARSKGKKSVEAGGAVVVKARVIPGAPNWIKE